MTSSKNQKIDDVIKKSENQKIDDVIKKSENQKIRKSMTSSKNQKIRKSKNSLVIMRTMSKREIPSENSRVLSTAKKFSKEKNL